MKKIGLLVVVVFIFSQLSYSQTSGDYRSAATGDWNSTSTWETYNGSAWVAAVATPTSTDGVITIRNGHTVTITATVIYDQVVVDPGGQVTVAATVTSTLANGAGTDLVINGTWLNSGGTWTVTGATWSVGSGGTYIHNTTSGIATPLGAVTLDPASNFIYRGSSTLTPTISWSGRSYGNLSFESSSGTWTGAVFTGASNSSCYDLTIGSGVNLSETYTGIFTVAGNFTNNGTIINSTGTQVYTFTGVGKTIGGSTETAFETFNINSGASITLTSNISVASTFTATVSGTLDCGSSSVFSGAGAFTLNADATLKTSNTGGLASSITISGTVTFTAGANYTFNGATTTPFHSATLNNPKNVTIGANVTLNKTTTVTGTLTLNSGIFNANSTLTIGAAGIIAYNGGSLSNYSDVPNLVTLSSGGTVTLPPTMGALTVLSGTNSLANSVIVNGNFTINNGATLNADPGNLGQTITIKGNWVNNSTGGFIAGQSKIIMNGSTGQTMHGSEFYDLEINDPSGVSLETDETVTHSLILTSGVFAVGAHTLTLQGTITGTPTNLSTDATSSIVISGSGSGINIPTSVISLGSLTLSNGTDTQLQGPLSLAGTLTLTSGTLTNSSYLTLGNSATISRSGGSLDDVPTFGTSVNLNYLQNGSQITTSFELPTSTTVLNNLTINSSNGVLLTAPVTAKGVFTLTSGIITTTANLLTFTETATVGMGSGTSFVNGPMAYIFATSGSKSRYYPIGKNGIWRPLLFSLNQSAATPSTYTAEMFNSVPATNNMPGTLVWVSGVRYHTISETGGGSAFTAGSLERLYGTDDLVSDTPNLRIAQGPAAGGGTWVDLGGTGVGSPNGNITSTVPFTDLTTNTVFVLANAVGGLNNLPVELSSFTAASSNGAIVLSWKTAVEIKNHGFDVERSADNITWTKLTFVQGHGNSNSPKNYSYTDNTVGKAGNYYYRLKQLDNDGGYKYSSVAEAKFVVPDVYSLSQNYPNPFNPSTKINYTLPSDSRVTLDVYNILGVKVGQLVNQDQSAGYYSVAFSTSSLNKSITSGVYLYKITAVDKATGNSFSAIKKMMMLK